MFANGNLARRGSWGLGAIHRDSNRKVLASATWRTRGFEDPTMAKAMALYKSAQMGGRLLFSLS